MSNDLEHQKSILLLEDNKVFVRPVIRWLKKAGYHALLVPTLADALRQLEKERYHLAIVDLRLDDNDPGNNDGMEFLRIKDELGLRNTMPVIVLTANATTDNILRAFNQFSVFSYIEKRPGYEEKLLQTIDNAFQEKIQINFSLTYDEGSDQILDEIVKDIYWSDLPVADIHLLVCEMQDLFGKLFKNAERIYLKKLTPGFSGAGLVKAEPYWAGTGIGPARVVKVDRLDKSLTERDHYENFVKNFLPWSTTQVSYEQSQHLGGAIYSFAEDASVAFAEFDDFYRKSNLVDIEESLHGLILKTCRFWYAHTNSQHANLQTLYFKAFSLEKTRLVKAFKELLPDYDAIHPTMRLPEYDIPLTNPLQWLTIHEKQCILAVNMCITHGDMTGRNIMVDGNGKCWLIDFLRTYESHSLRDFVILETDLKYRLGLEMENNKYLEFEKNLIHRGVHDNAGRMPGRWDKEVRKLFSVIMKVRSLARQVGFSVANPSQMDVEYLISLLMATLNVIRLRHIPRERKLQAIYAANLICDELAKKFTLSGI